MTVTIDKNAPFPLDWNEWRSLWKAWLAEQLDAGNLKRSTYKFPGKNFIADEVLGVWSVNGRNVELSETTFMQSRGVGITYGDASGRYVPSDLGADRLNVCHSFAELEQELYRDA